MTQPTRCHSGICHSGLPSWTWRHGICSACQRIIDERNAEFAAKRAWWRRFVVDLKFCLGILSH